MAIILRDVSASYGEVEALKNINLQFKMNQINALIGRSGSGKTTLIEIITMFQKPKSGSLKITDNQKIGFVFEFPNKQFFCRTIAEELRFGLKSKKNQKKIADVLKIVGLDESYLKRNPHHLSNGEKRKVAIAAVLIANPDILIFDEPTVGLDRNSKENLTRLIKLLKLKYHKTIIIVSQDIDFVYSFADYVYLLSEGQLVGEGEKIKLLTNVEKLKKYDIMPPKIVTLTEKINQQKNLKLEHRVDINDLLKDVYRHAR